MDVVETWNIYISETNTLFKSFEIATHENYKMKNIKVSRIENGQESFLEQIDEQQYRVTSGCFYGLQIDDSTFEIAWNVGLDNSSDSRKYKIYYTVENVVAIHNDCTEMYWQFLGDENSISGNNITGTIKLPKRVANMEKLRIWGHGPLDAVINKESNQLINFSLDSIKANQMLEVRVVTEENIYEQSTNFTKKNVLNDILSQEQNWADDANRERENEKEGMYKIIINFAIMIFFFILIFFKKREYKLIGKELKEKYSYVEKDLEYFRDIPDEKNATPARAVYFYNFIQNYSNLGIYGISRIFSATILNLCLKGFIKFEVENQEVEIYVLKDNKTEINFLTRDELIIFNILKNAIKDRKCITPKEFSKYASDNYQEVYNKLNEIEDFIKEDIKLMHKISAEREHILQEWKNKSLMYILFIGLSIFCTWQFPILFIGFWLLESECNKNSKYICILSEKGNVEEKQWKALKRYMEDYSLLEEKKISDIVLWEKYLVYATAFGISKKVMKQLKLIHPEMFEIQTIKNSYKTNSYWNIMSNDGFGNNHFEKFTDSLMNIYTKVQYTYRITNTSSRSSGSGAGGGFSSGGGGRRR